MVKATRAHRSAGYAWWKVGTPRTQTPVSEATAASSAAAVELGCGARCEPPQRPRRPRSFRLRPPKRAALPQELLQLGEAAAFEQMGVEQAAIRAGDALAVVGEGDHSHRVPLWKIREPARHLDAVDVR
jgi:hypothetical protein